MPLFKNDLNDYVKTRGCENASCTTDHTNGVPFFVHSACHPESPLHVMYSTNGVLTVMCAQCSQVIIDVFVAGKGMSTHESALDDFLFGGLGEL